MLAHFRDLVLLGSGQRRELIHYVVLNVYTLNLRPSMVKELVGTLRDCYESLVDDLEKFCEFMEIMVSNGE
ncbi:MAG: hypothetical protein ACKPCM_14885 [Pseudanabaena sp.]